jgi:hypothetical protein
MAIEPGIHNQDSMKPNPDPTIATNEAVERAVKSERDYVDGQIAVLVERLNGIDTATTLRLGPFEAIPTTVDEKIRHLFELMSEKFGSVQTQFAERDERAVRESTANTVAVNAAFAAQKEAAAEQNKSNTLAIDKSEIATKEAIGKLAELVQTGMNALSDKLDDVKERVARLEDRISRLETTQVVAAQTKTESRDTSRFGIQVMGALIGVVLFAVTILEVVNGIKR